MSFRILTVCLGNICRSPAAEAVIRSKAAEAGVEVEVDSAGTGSYHIGESPHPKSIAVGGSRGYTVEGAARQLHREDFDRFDLIVTMDDTNLANAQRIAPESARAEIRSLMSYVGGAEVPDPWGQPDSAYEHMYDLIEQAADALILDLKAQA